MSTKKDFLKNTLHRRESKNYSYSSNEPGWLGRWLKTLKGGFKIEQ